MYTRDVQQFLWILVLAAVVYSAPTGELAASKSIANKQQSNEPLITRSPSEVNADTTPALPLADSSEEEEEEEGNKEVVDYQTIQKDSNSKVVNNKQNANDVFDQKENPALSDEEADQLMMLMSDPVAIAEYLAVSGDIVGFLEVLDALQMNGFIDGKVADRLKNEVSGELDRLLIEKDSEEKQMYQNEGYPMQPQNEVYMENEMLNVIKQIMTLPVLTPGEVYQAMLYEGASDLVASVAGLVYQRIIEREISPEAGVSLVAAVFQLSLPNEYIPEEVTDESFYEDAFLDYVLETMSHDENIISDVIGDEDGESQEDEKIEDVPLVNAAGKQIGQEQNVYSSRPLKTKEGKTIGKEIHDEVKIQIGDGGSLEEELQDMAVNDETPETREKSSSEIENADGYGSGESEVEHIFDDKEIEQLPDILKMRLKNYFKGDSF